MSGPMVLAMKAIGKKTKRMAKAHIYTRMEIYIKAHLSLEIFMDMVKLQIKMEI
jgi:hypothetical protein